MSDILEQIREVAEHNQKQIDAVSQRVDEMLAKGARPNVGGATLRETLADSICRQIKDQAGEIRQALEKHGRIAFEVQKDAADLTSNGLISGPMIGPLAGAKNALRLRREIAHYPISTGAVFALRETGLVNNAASQIESELKGHSVVNVSGEALAVSTYAHYTVVTKQALDDIESLGAFLNARLSYGLARAIENGLVNGDGTNGALTGVYQNGTNATSNLSGVSALDSVIHIADELEAAGYVPTHFICNPTDLRKKLLTAKNNSADYLIGNIVSIPDPLYLWGLKVVPSVLMPSGKGLVCDLSQVHIRERQTARVELSEHAGDSFTRNQVVIRAEERLAAVIHQTAAFRKFSLP